MFTASLLPSGRGVARARKATAPCQLPCHRSKRSPLCLPGAVPSVCPARSATSQAGYEAATPARETRGPEVVKFELERLETKRFCLIFCEIVVETSKNFLRSANFCVLVAATLTVTQIAVPAPGRPLRGQM